MPWKGNSSLNSDYFDPDAIAREVLTGANNTNQTSLIPSSSASVDLPSMPTYTAPTKETFDWNVPVSERPAGTEDWIWSRSRWAKENFDNEQKSKSDEAYRKYQTDLQNWQNTLSLINAQKEAEQQKLENYNTMLSAQGLTPMTSLSDYPSVQIRQLGQAWQNTTDPTLRNQYHQQALQVAQKAGLIPEGYTGSVNGLATLSAAGTPDYATTYKERAYKDAIAQQQLENQLAQDKYDLSASKASGSGGGGGTTNSTKPPTSTQLNAQASDYIKNNLSKYKRAIDFVAQVKRNISNGKINASVGSAIFKLMSTLYPTEKDLNKTLSTWEG